MEYLDGDLAKLEVRARLTQTRERWNQAVQEVAAWEGLYRDGGAQHPDGVAALRNARLKLGLAGERYRQALNDFTEVVLKGLDRNGIGPRIG